MNAGISDGARESGAKTGLAAGADRHEVVVTLNVARKTIDDLRVIENDATPKELSDRLTDSVLFHSAHALMLARMLLGNGKRHK